MTGTKFHTEVRLSREMRLIDVTLIGVGAMIGAGIFVLTGIAAGVAGPALVVAFSLNGAIALLTAMSYAELGSCYHDAGGGYLWVKEGLPKWNGFLAGWMSWFAHAVACSLYALGFGAYMERLLQAGGMALPRIWILPPQTLMAAGIAVVFAYINFRGASETGKVGNLVTMAKIAVLGVFIAFGLEYILGHPDPKAPFTPFMPNGWSGVIHAMGLTFIAFQGFEVIAQCSEEVRLPRRNIPRAIFYSLLIVVPIYLLVAVTAIGSVSPGNLTPWDYLAQSKETALVEVAAGFFNGGGIMILLGGLVSTMSALNATVYSSSRVAFAMGRDRNFPALFSKVHARKHTPHWAIVFSMFIVVLMAVSLPIEDVASAADIMFLLLFFQVNVAAIRLRKKRPDLDRGFVIPLFPWLSVLGIVLLLFLAVFMFGYSPIAWALTAGWIGVGLVVHRAYASRREVEHVRKVAALERLEKRDYRILVSVANAATMPSLARIGLALAEKNRAEIIFLNVLEADEGEPLESGLGRKDQAEDLLRAAEELVAGANIEVRSVIAVSHRVSQGIVETAEAESCNLIVVGRNRSPSLVARYASAVLDSVLQETTAEVVFVHGTVPERPKVSRIILPFGEDVHSRLAIEIAPALLEFFGCELYLVLVLSPDTRGQERMERVERAESIVRAADMRAQILAVEHSDIILGIAQVAGPGDLMLMGGRSGSFLEMLVASSVTEDITRQVRCPVIWVEEYEETESVLVRLFRRDEPVE